MFKQFAWVVIIILICCVPNNSVGSVQADETSLPPLTEIGPYGVGRTLISVFDDTRDDWELEIFILYPTEEKPTDNEITLVTDAQPEFSNAPYPLIVYSHGWLGNFAEFMDLTAYLASHGYVVVAPFHHDTAPVKFELVDRPLDIMLMLDEITAGIEENLVDIIDTDNIGMIGFDAGSGAVLQMLGLHRDPIHYATWCAENPDSDLYDCFPEENFGGSYPLEEIADYRNQLGLEDLSDGTWAPFDDTRIRAVMTIAPCDFPLSTEDMLSKVTTPLMILHGTNDPFCNYEGNAVRMYMNLTNDDRYLISFIRGRHTTFHQIPEIAQHFSQAFFGYHLKGDESYAPYLTSDGMPNWDIARLIWGPYDGE